MKKVCRLQLYLNSHHEKFPLDFYHPIRDLMEEKLLNGKRKRVNHKKILIDNIFKPGLFLQINEFLKMLSSKKNDLITVKEYLETVKLIKRIYV